MVNLGPPAEKQTELWIAVFAAEYVRLRAAGEMTDVSTIAEEAMRVADLAVRSVVTLRVGLRGSKEQHG